MPEYEYEALDLSGKLVTGISSHPNMAFALAKLQKLGLHPVKLNAKPASTTPARKSPVNQFLPRRDYSTTPKGLNKKYRKGYVVHETPDGRPAPDPLGADPLGKITFGKNLIKLGQMTGFGYGALILGALLGVLGPLLINPTDPKAYLIGFLIFLVIFIPGYIIDQYIEGYISGGSLRAGAIWTFAAFVIIAGSRRSTTSTSYTTGGQCAYEGCSRMPSGTQSHTRIYCSQHAGQLNRELKDIWRQETGLRD